MSLNSGDQVKGGERSAFSRVSVRRSDRRPPDPTARLRRIRRLRRRVGSRPAPADVRRVLTYYRRRRTTRGLAPRAVLEQARLLHPFDPAVHLWLFEACLAESDHRGATVALRDARRQQADPVRVLLARARLLVDRGRSDAARYVLLKRPKATRRDPRMRCAIEALAG